MSAMKNKFRRAVDLNAAEGFLDSSKTAQVGEMDRAAQAPAAAPAPAALAPAAPEPTPAPPVEASARVAPVAAAVEALVEKEITAELPQLLAMERAAAPKTPRAPKPPSLAPIAEAPKAILRPDGTPANERVMKQLNIALPETKYYEVKDFVEYVPRTSLRQFIEDAIFEKIERMKGDVKR